MAVNQQQLDYLSAMGIPVWVSRDLPMPDQLTEQKLGFDLERKLPVKLIGETISLPQHESSALASVKAAAVTEASKKGLQAADELIKGLQQTPVKQIADLVASLDEMVEAKPQVISKNLDGVDWVELKKAVSECTACDLHEKRQHTVFGHGNKQPSLMIVGDIPRLSDEQKMQPFTGETGELLSNMLSHTGVSDDTIYYANLLKCRTPLDNSPQLNQAASCLSYLNQQIKLLHPPLVLLMGRSTAQQVLGEDKPMAELRMKIHQLDGLNTRFVVTYHPAYLLKQPRLKALVWQDLQLIKQALVN